MAVLALLSGLLAIQHVRGLMPHAGPMITFFQLTPAGLLCATSKMPTSLGVEQISATLASSGGGGVQQRAGRRHRRRGGVRACWRCGAVHPGTALL